MKTALRTTCVLIGLGVATAAAAEELRLGPVANWDGGVAEVALMEMEGSVVIGSISEDGMMSMILPAPESDEALPVSFIFGCDDEGKVDVSAPEATFSVTDLQLVRDGGDENLGDVGGFSSPEYGAAWMKAMGTGNTAKEQGSRYRLIYLSEPVSAKGRCVSEFLVDGVGSTPVMVVDEYDIDFTAGWQLLKTLTRDTVTSKENMTFPLDTLMQGLPLNAEEASWYFDPF